MRSTDGRAEGRAEGSFLSTSALFYVLLAVVHYHIEWSVQFFFNQYCNRVSPAP